LNVAETRRFFIVVAPATLAIALVVAVVALVADSGTASSPPHINVDHWHARYQYVVCGELQFNAPQWDGGVHTHADGIIHIHPVEPEEEGRGARLVKWFEYGGGTLDDDEVRLPGENITHHNGDECPDGSEGVVQVYIEPAATGVEERLEDWSQYIPQDGDQVLIWFGPEFEE
jgi:hypothetical protein